MIAPACRHDQVKHFGHDRKTETNGIGVFFVALPGSHPSRKGNWGRCGCP